MDQNSDSMAMIPELEEREKPSSLESRLASEYEPFLADCDHHQQQHHTTSRHNRTVRALTTLLCLSLFCSAILVLLLLRRRSEHLSTFSTDFGPATSSVKYKQVLFNAGPAFHDNGSMYIEHASHPAYTGESSPAIDAAWDKLLFGRYFSLNPAEAQAAFGASYQDYYSPEHETYIAGLDIFHTLHCVNQLRRAFDPSYYGAIEPIHRNHCLDQIRQYVMCAGDITPVPTRYYAGLRDPHDAAVHGGDYVMSDVVHTCRDFGRLREWLTERYEGSSVKWDG